MELSCHAAMIKMILWISLKTEIDVKMFSVLELTCAGVVETPNKFPIVQRSKSTCSGIVEAPSSQMKINKFENWNLYLVI